MKITIIGYSGSGKTSLAKRISEKFNIPHQQIDRIWFREHGHLVKTEVEKNLVREAIRKEIFDFIKNENWVSDGFYKRLQPILADEADLIVLLELPLWRRLLNHWKRILQKTDRHPEVTRWQDFLHSGMIVKRTFTYQPHIKEFKEKYQDKLIHLKSFGQINDFFDSLEKIS